MPPEAPHPKTPQPEASHPERPQPAEGHSENASDSNQQKDQGHVENATKDDSPLRAIEEIEHEFHDIPLFGRTSMESILEQERRQGRLRLRSRMATLNHFFTMTRIDTIEKQLRDVRATLYPTDEEFTAPPQKNTKFPVHRHELRRSTKSDFRLDQQSVLMPTTQQAALEVLISESTFTSRPMDEIKVTTTAESLIQQGTYSSPTDATIGMIERREQPTPQRLRIRSRSLMSHLQNITKVSVLSVAQTDSMQERRVYCAVVFLRPFKFFVKHETAIRKSLEKLEALDQERRSQEKIPKPACERANLESTRAERRDFDDEDLLQDLRLLIHFLDVDLRPTYDLRQRIKSGTATEIEYADLWHLFNRGDLVVTRSDHTNAYLVVNIVGGREPLTNRYSRDETEKSFHVEGFVIDVISLGSDGTSYVPELKSFVIRNYQGKREISSLQVYPLHFDPKAEDLRARFRQNGSHFLEVTRHTFCHKTVKGMTQDEPSHELDAQVIIDMALAMSEHPEWQIQSTVSMEDLTHADVRETLEKPWCGHLRPPGDTCCGSDVIFNDLELDSLDLEEFMRDNGRNLGPLSSEDITDLELILLRPNVHAFVLRSRQWVTVRTADLHDVEFQNNFHDLLLPGDHKTTVQALVKTHENTRMSQSTGGATSIGSALELVKGKGSGLIILLHGPPGVGKTSTAECVADDTRRPLYPITCGDIGETAVDVEQHLQHNFKLAHKWGCVLLLDEADVFLARRSKKNLRHNAVTSIFLRSLEYYAGILFLTTNRVGAIDPAFKSRIQMTLFYPKLDIDVTCKLYKKFIKRVKARQDATGNHLFEVKEKEILKFARKHFRALERRNYDTWNGRQIHNAFQTAIALAEHESKPIGSDGPKPVLGKSQFETVAHGFQKFDEYLYSTLGATEGDTAKREGVRDDSYMNTGAGNMTIPLIPSRMVPSQAYGTPKAQASGQITVTSESDDDLSSDNDSDKDSDEDERQRKSPTGKSTLAASVDEKRFKEYQAFLEFQERMKS